MVGERTALARAAWRALCPGRAARGPCVTPWGRGKGGCGAGVTREPGWALGGGQGGGAGEAPGREAGLGLCPAVAPRPAEAPPCPAVPCRGQLVNFIV